MRQVILAVALVSVPVWAWAQAPDQQAQQQGMQATVMDQLRLVNDKNTAIAALQAQLADLQKQLAAAQAKSQESPK